MSASGAGWHPDPTGRHEFRWWDGAAWSDVVADQGVEHHDPIAAAPPSPAVPAPAAHAPPSPASYPPAGAPPGGSYASGAGHAPAGGYPSGGGAPRGGPPGGERSGLATGLLVGFGVAITALLVVLDRHGGVISGFTLSTTSDATSPNDRAMVEELTNLAAQRLTGQAEPGQAGQAS